jgi:tetratricopeptide (TPR) repeat protein
LHSESEHSITLPLLSEKDESITLPLVINVVTRYWGEEIPLDNGVAVKNYSGLKGPIMIEGIDRAEKSGFVSYIYEGSMRDLKKRVDQGIPPIVITPGIHETIQHATIICGYNPEERRLLTYVPQPDTVGAIPEVKFEQDWKQDGMVTLILIPKDMGRLFKNEDLRFKDSNRICFEAERLHHQGNSYGAIDKLRKAVEIDSENPQAWCLLGGVYNELNSEEAVLCYEKTIKINQNYYLAYRGLGNYYLKKKDYTLAEAYYTKAIEINPYRFGPIYKNRAVARLQLNNNPGAKEDLIKYLEQTPNAGDRTNVKDALDQL